jgi:hypothetical protein
MGCVPDHVPGLAVCGWPSTGEPEIVGGVTLVGLAAPRTSAVGFDAALSEPWAFVAVTRTRSRRPTSPLRTWYVLPSAPPMGGQFEPSGAPPPLGHRSQRYAKDIGVEPDQVPRFAVSVRPSTASPTMLGSPVLFGGFPPPRTIRVGFDAALSEPSAFVAVTRTRSLRPTSPLRTWYVLSSAPSMGAQFEPSGAPPLLGHRSQRYAKDIGVLPDHDP